MTTSEVSIVLSDPDGTTNEVKASLIHGIQVWEFDLEDLDGDNQWEGSIEVNPETAGRPSLRITATDGSGDSATVSQVSRTIVVTDAEPDRANVSFIVGGGSILVAILVVSIVIARRRRIRLEDELIESWDSLSRPSETGTSQVEGGAVDASEEVVNDVWSQLEQQEGLD